MSFPRLERPRRPGLSTRGEVARHAILEAAIRVVGERGLSEASLAVVAAEAGASKASVLYHFGTRERLLRAVASQTLDRLYERIAKTTASLPRGRDAIRVGVEALFAREHRPVLMASREMSGLGMRDTVVGREVQDGFEELAKLVARLIPSPEPRAQDIGHAVVMAVHGYVDLWLCSGEDDPGRFRSRAIEAAHAILDSIGKP